MLLLAFLPHFSDGIKVDLPWVVTFLDDEILTTVTYDRNIVDGWIWEIERIHRRRLHRLICGLDVEWRPSFTRGMRNPAATLQLCVGRRCLIFQLIHCPSIPPSLIRFLQNPSYTFVGVGVGADLGKLQVDYDFGINVNFVDLRDLAADEYGWKHLRRAGLKGLASLVLEIEVEKPENVRLSRWDNEWLTPSQVCYACVDAFMSFEIGRMLGAA